MKKKFIIAALLAGVMAATCLTGYTCNGNGDGENGEQQGQEQEGSFEKGVEVTAEEWASAVNASMSLQNFTFSYLDNISTTVMGYYKGNDKVPVNLANEYNGNLYEYVDSSSNNFCGGGISETDLLSGFADLYSYEEYTTYEWWESLGLLLGSYGIGFREDGEKFYTEDIYDVKIGEKQYTVKKYVDNDEDIGWWVDEYDFINNLGTLSEFLQFATEENGEEKSLTELYDAFTYSDGVYTSDLEWLSRYAVMPPISIMSTWSVSVSIKDGYILSVDIKCTKSGVEEKDGLTVTYLREGTYKIYDIGKTSITLPDEAVKAIDDYIKENS